MLNGKMAKDIMPIAVVGMACKYPGEASSVQGLWKMCCEGQSAWSEILENRFSFKGFWHPDPSRKGCFNNRGAHFMKEDPSLFDAPFFSISPNEAKAMDPQQRLLLECSYEALENAGIPLRSISGRDVGVFVGASMSDYQKILDRDTETSPMYQATGTSSNIISNRVSYAFNLKGPSITVDTACSSSLVALHLACQSLRAGESCEALVGGVFVLLSPDAMSGMSYLRLFSEEGKCYTYDSRGTGYGRGEGVATLVLKPLQDALDAGDHIWTVIRNTGINQDGKTNGITMPNQEAQAELIQSVYQSAGIDPAETCYVEAHGTGTAAGDPVEAGAIATAMASKRSPDKPLIVGSIKTNIGHSEAASGLAGLIKAAMILQTGIIPPNINFEKPNEKIPLDQWNLKVPTSLLQYPSDSIRRASICSFGFGGTNAHVILERPRQELQLEDTNPEKVITNGIIDSNVVVASDGLNHLNGLDGTEFVNGMGSFKQKVSRYKLENADAVNGSGAIDHENRLYAKPGSSLLHAPEKNRIYVLSASNKASTKMQVINLINYLRQQVKDKMDWTDDLCYTLAQRRSLLEWRVAVPVTTPGGLIDSFQSTGLEPISAIKSPKIAFVFTGQGSQWQGMGIELMREYPVFTSTLREADKCLRNLGATWSLIDELTQDADASLINKAYISQPATTAIQLALISLFSSWNIKPHAVVGHSSGEIAAAYAAQALSLESCMRIAYYRGALSSSMRDNMPDRHGAMLAVGASAEIVQTMLKRIRTGKAVIACFNAPSLMTVSGDESAIEELQFLAEEDKVFSRNLRVEIAYHSYHMDAIALEYLEAIRDITANLAESEVEFYSSLKGRRIDKCSLNPSYWVNNLTSPVQFSNAVEELCSGTPGTSIDALIEIGPHSTLEAAVKDILKSTAHSKTVQYLSSLSRGKDASATTLQLASSLFMLGSPVDLSAINMSGKLSKPRVLGDLPSYPWMHDKSHWHDSRLDRNHRLRAYPRNDVLGSLLDTSSDTELQWRNILRTAELPWLHHHKIQSSTVFPLAGYLCMVVEAAYQRATTRGIKMTESSKYNFRDVMINRSLMIADSTEIETLLTLRPYNEGTQSSSEKWDDFGISSWQKDSGWQEHCRGLISVTQADAKVNLIDGERNAQEEETLRQELIARKEADCTTSLNCTKAYQALAKAGLQFGPAFRNVSDARVCLNHSVCTVKVPDTASLMPYGYESELIVHPATLDACLHSIPFAVEGGIITDDTLHVPTFIESLSISHCIPWEPADKLHVYTNAESDKLGKEIHASLIVLDATSKLLVDIKGFIGSRLPSQDDKNASVRTRGLCYKSQWRPHINSLRPQQYNVLFPAETEVDEDSIQEIMMERVAFHCIQGFFDSFSTTSLDEIQPHHRRFYDQMEATLKQGWEGNIPLQTSEWLGCTATDRKDYLNKMRLSDDCFELICRMGENLSAIFQQSIDPLKLILEDNRLDRIYDSHISLQQPYASCVQYADLLAHENPFMRILEVGGGSSSLAMSVLKSLGGASGSSARFTRYDFTAVSGDLLAISRNLLNAWGEMITYGELDIRQDPTTQGFAFESYDLVIASDLQAGNGSNSIDSTMRNVRRLLKSGGKLIILEKTTPYLYQSIIFGTLQGWWTRNNVEQSREPMLDDEQWDILLRHTGFGGLDGFQSTRGGCSYDSRVRFSSAVINGVDIYPAAAIISNSSSHSGLSIRRLRQSLNAVTEESFQLSSLAEATIDHQYVILLELDEQTLPQLDDEKLQYLKTLFANVKGILWVVRGASQRNPDANMSTGFARCVRSEVASLKLVTIDLDMENQLSDEDTADTIADVFKTAFSTTETTNPCDMEYIERNGIIQIPRFVADIEKDIFILQETQPLAPEPQPYQQNGRSLRLEVAQPGLLDSIYFANNDVLNSPIGAHEVDIKIVATGMNFKDVMEGLGQIPYVQMGRECSGDVVGVGSKVSNLKVGDRVCAMIGGSYANFTRAPEHVVAKVPREMTYTDAASVPVVFCTAYAALINSGHLTSGQTILVHAAAGGVGQAAVMLAKYLGAEIFVTVGSTEKKDFIMATYAIPEDHIFSSRDTSFEQGVLRATGNKGVNVVLNSLSGEALRLSWNCVAPLGRFVEIGKRDLVLNTSLEMSNFQRGATFTGLDLGVIAKHDPLAFKKLMTDTISLFGAGKVRPVSPITTFSMDEVEKGLRLMQSGKHIGKIVVEARGDEIVKACTKIYLSFLHRLFTNCEPKVLPAVRDISIIRPDASYILTGGTGGLGRSLTRWLATQGAKNIILASRSGLNSKVQLLINELQAIGVRVAVYACDIGDEDQVRKLVEDASHGMPPIRGVIHGAMVLRDVLFERMTIDDWTDVVRPRVQGLWNLHRALLDIQLDFFVISASASGIAGNKGQAAYCASNTFMDAFSQYRFNLGLPASTIDIGLVADVGYVAESTEARQAQITSLNHDKVEEREIHALVKAAIAHPNPDCDYKQTITGLRLFPNLPLPWWAFEPKFSHIRRSVATLNASTSSAGDASLTVRKALKAATNLETCTQVILDAIIGKLSAVSMTPKEDISVQKPMVAYGLDSLVAVEIRNWMAGELEAKVPLLELMTSASLVALAEVVVRRSKLMGHLEES